MKRGVGGETCEERRRRRDVGREVCAARFVRREDDGTHWSMWTKQEKKEARLGGNKRIIGALNAPAYGCGG